MYTYIYIYVFFFVAQVQQDDICLFDEPGNLIAYVLSPA